MEIKQKAFFIRTKAKIIKVRKEQGYEAITVINAGRYV